ncbi:MAG: hypothetical protein AB8B50_09505 [Pirellulaceae bacterium]
MKFAAFFLLVLSFCLGTPTTVGFAQEAASESASFEFELPEGSEDFGDASYEADTTMTAEEAAAGAMMAAGLTALCTSLPALLLGLAIGYFLGRKRAAPRSSS